MSTVPFGPPPTSGSNPLRLLSDPGVSQGVNLDSAPHEMPPGFGRYLKDVLLDVPGFVRQRGPVSAVNFPGLPTGFTTIGMTSLGDPNGSSAFRILILGVADSTGHVWAYVYGRSSALTTQPMSARGFFELMEPLDVSGRVMGDPYLYFDGRRGNTSLVGNFSQLLAINLSTTLGNLNLSSADAEPFFQTSMALDGGALLGFGSRYSKDPLASAHRAMLHWRGAAKAHIGLTCGVTQNSPTVTAGAGAFLTQLEPGMFLTRQSDGRVLGVVKSVETNTSCTLEQNVLNTTNAALACFFEPIRRPYTNNANSVSAGTVITSITSAVVQGGGTKFVDQGVANGDLMFRASDYTFLGTVTSVQSNSQLTLTGNAAFALASEDYVITRAAPWGVGSEPVFSAFYNGMQLLASADNIRGGLQERSRIFVTDTKNLEAIDLTKTGSFYDLPSTKPHTDIRGMIATESAALVFLAEATYGLFGNDPAALSPKVVHNDGCLSPMTIASWQGGAVWAGHRSVYWFDGATVRDLLDGRIARAHQQALAGLDYSKYRAWGMVHNKHYICAISRVNTGIFTHTQGRFTTLDDSDYTVNPTSIVYAINLVTGAVVFWSNVNLRGYTAPPGTLEDVRDAYFLVENSSTGGPSIASAEALFQTPGTTGAVGDAFLTNPLGADFAPHFYVEGRLNDYGDPERVKRAQMLLGQYTLYGPGDSTKLGVDVVKGLARDTKSVSMRARTSSDVANVVSWSNKRSRFSTKSTLFATRFYTMIDGAPQAAQLGPWSLGAKILRPGRV